jgi:hypothetical protein
MGAKEIFMSQTRQQIIQSYIDAYNTFDLNNMYTHLSDDITFKNTENGIVTVSTEGLDAFKKVSEKSQEFFQWREQKVLQFDEGEDFIIVYVDFEAILKQDLGNDFKKGDKFKFGAKSIFNFKDDKIVSIEDYS